MDIYHCDYCGDDIEEDNVHFDMVREDYRCPRCHGEIYVTETIEEEEEE